MSQDANYAAQMELLNTIHHVDGFDPSLFAVEYNDLTSGETRKRIPVMIQIAWFRLRYPEGKIAVDIQQKNNCFVATARVHPNYKDDKEFYLAEATASRQWDSAKPSISPREWAQTAAIGIALRNAGFGVQFHAAGDDFPTEAPKEFDGSEQDTQTHFTNSGKPTPPATPSSDTVPQVPAPEAPVSQPQTDTPPLAQAPAPEPVIEMTPEQQFQADLTVPCPIAKYNGLTLGEVMKIDPHALVWVATKYDANKATSEAAKRICEYAKQQAVA